MKLWYVTSGSLSDYIHACGHALYVSAGKIIPYLWLHFMWLLRYISMDIIDAFLCPKMFEQCNKSFSGHWTISYT